MAGFVPLLGLIGAGFAMTSMGGAETPAPPPPPPPPPEPPVKEDAEIQKAIEDEQRRIMDTDSPADQNLTKNKLSRQDPLTATTNVTPKEPVNKKATLLGG
jgi:hypothetical protein